MSAFRFGHAAADDWRQAAERCLAQLGDVPATGNLGFLYVTDALANDMPDVLEHFKEATGVAHWVGTVGIGICATGAEYYETPALAVMIGEFPTDSFRVIPPIEQGLDELDPDDREWIDTHRPYIGIVHGDPASPHTEGLVEALASITSSGFLVGGLASSSGPVAFYADRVFDGGLSGVLFSEDVPVSTRLSQGCSPIGHHHRITESQRNIIIRLDERPALDVFKADIGEALAEDLGGIAGLVFAGLPIAGSDTGDYLVRNLVGIDPQNKLIAIGDLAEEETPILFCRRDADTAREDLKRMLGAIKERMAGTPRGGIYVSCLGRGVNLFGPDSDELRIIQSELGEVPIVGFYANGEISRDRLYGYTGVLTLFE